MKPILKCILANIVVIAAVGALHDITEDISISPRIPQAYIAANEKRENARTIAYGRLQGKTNIISQGIDATDAPPGGTATRKGSSSTYKSVSDVLNSGRTQQEQVTILQKEFNLSKAAAETQIYGSPVTNL